MLFSIKMTKLPIKMTNKDVQYCKSNIGLFSIAPYIDVAFNFFALFIFKVINLLSIAKSY